MRKNGFTLIELLAVIVILAIIALIATPIILGIINDAREKANERSVELYAAAVKNGIAAYQLTGLNAPKSFSDLTIQYDGDVKCTVQELYEDGSFYLEGCKVNNGDKEYSYGTKQSSESACTLDDKDADGKASLSDVVTCGTESFYIMSNDGTNIEMLTMYNLDVGNTVEVIEDPYSVTIAPIENPTGIQNKNAKGFDFNTYKGYGLLYVTYHWLDSSGNLLSKYGTTYPAYVYDENFSLYPYLNSYGTYLKEQGMDHFSLSLMSLEQAKKLGCTYESYHGTCKSAPSWMYSTSYYTGTVEPSASIVQVYMTGIIDSEVFMGNFPTFGVRPVITISTSEIQ